jgi:putative endonuclease
MSTQQWFLYIVRCRHGTLYTGISTDVQRRFAEHQQGGVKGARYLRGKGPLALVYQVHVNGRAEATRLELWLKKQPREMKESLILNQTNIYSLFAKQKRNNHLR